MARWPPGRVSRVRSSFPDWSFDRWKMINRMTVLEFASLTMSSVYLGHDNVGAGEDRETAFNEDALFGARPLWPWTLRSSSTLACRERIQLPTSAEISRLACSSSSPAAARLAISFWKSWASSTDAKSGTWIVCSTKR